MLLRVKDCAASLYLPRQGSREVRSDGKNLLTQGVEAESVGFDAILPATMLQEHMARLRGEGPVVLWARFGPVDAVDHSREDTGLYLSRRFAHGFGGAPTENSWRLKTLRQRFPDFHIKDVTPAIDRLRMIKTPREIEVLRENGRISAEGMRRAIAVTRPGLYEYQIEATARAWFDWNGGEGVAYPAIVASGPNLLVWHYFENERQLEADDIIVMDFGIDRGHLTMDITRTWPVDGEFTELQQRAYNCVLESLEAVIATMNPGATRQDTRDVGKKIYEKWGFGDHRPGSAGHFVGMATHDVGDYTIPFEAGMVIAVEPIIAIDEEELHVRIEETVLITDDGAEILSVGVPKKMDEVLALVGSESKK
jgi:Xaa-Pro aminopeptidase